VLISDPLHLILALKGDFLNFKKPENKIESSEDLKVFEQDVTQRI
jgi:hypothetical protein